MLAEAESTESEAQTAYEKLMQEAKVTKAAKQAEIKGKTSELKTLEVGLMHHRDDLDTVSKGMMLCCTSVYVVSIMLGDTDNLVFFGKFQKHTKINSQNWKL